MTSGRANCEPRVALDQGALLRGRAAQFDNVGTPKLNFIEKKKQNMPTNRRTVNHISIRSEPDRSRDVELRIEKAKPKGSDLSLGSERSVPIIVSLSECQLQRERTIGWNAFPQSPGRVECDSARLVTAVCLPVTSSEASENNTEE